MPFVYDPKDYDQSPYWLMQPGWSPYQAKGPALKARVSAPALVPTERTHLIIIYGQSNGTNCGIDHGSVSSKYVPNAKVQNFDVYTGGLYVGDDPMLGCDDLIGNSGQFGIAGSIWSRLGDLILAQTPIQRVIFAPISIGATSIQSWGAPGTIMASSSPYSSLFHRIRVLLARLDAIGMFPSKTGADVGTVATSFIGGLLGESDAGSDGFNALPADRWTVMYNNIVAAIRAHGVPSDVPFFVTQTTHPFQGTTPYSGDVIRAAQLACVDAGNHVYFGGDTDTLQGIAPAALANRQSDNIHLNGSVGQQAAAQLILDNMKIYGGEYV